MEKDMDAEILSASGNVCSTITELKLDAIDEAHFRKTNRVVTDIVKFDELEVLGIFDAKLSLVRRQWRWVVHQLTDHQ